MKRKLQSSWTKQLLNRWTRRNEGGEVGMDEKTSRNDSRHCKGGRVLHQASVYTAENDHNQGIEHLL